MLFISGGEGVRLGVGDALEQDEAGEFGRAPFEVRTVTVEVLERLFHAGDEFEIFLAVEEGLLGIATDWLTIQAPVPGCLMNDVAVSVQH